MKLICFYGPESTGKSTMAMTMAKRFHTEFVPEVSREMSLSNDTFTVDDVIRVGEAQTARVLAKKKIANAFLFCDTDLINIQIYSRIYLGVVPSVLYELEKQVTYDQYFFFDIDCAWVDDGFRDLGHRREEVKNIFLEELNKRKIPFTWVRGNWKEREEIVLKELRKLL